MVHPLSVIKINKYCGFGGGGGVAREDAKILQKIMAPLSLSLRLLSIVTSGEGVGAFGGAKILQKIMAPPLSVITIVKYFDVVGGGGALGALKSYKR